MYAPIALFAFNRSDLLKSTLHALSRNSFADQSSLTIFCDGPRCEAEKKSTDAVRVVAKAVQGFASVEVVCRETNMGCAGSIIDGLQQMFIVHDKLIVIEDDVLCSQHTLEFLNAGLVRYADCRTIFNIAAWSPPKKLLSIPRDYSWDVYAIPRFNCWGWASWRDRFCSIDWTVSDYELFRSSPSLRSAFNAGGDDMSRMLDAQMCGDLNSWDIRMDYARFKQGCVGINPLCSYTTNIGIGSGTHTTTLTHHFDNNIETALPVSQLAWLDQIFVDAQILRSYRMSVLPKLTRWKRTLKRILEILGFINNASST